MTNTSTTAAHTATLAANLMADWTRAMNRGMDSETAANHVLAGWTRAARRNGMEEAEVQMMRQLVSAVARAVLADAAEVA